MGNWGLTPRSGIVTLLATGRVKQQWPQIYPIENTHLRLVVGGFS